MLTLGIVVLVLGLAFFFAGFASFIDHMYLGFAVCALGVFLTIGGIVAVAFS